MGNSQSLSSSRGDNTPVPQDVFAIPSLWQAPSSSSSTQFRLSKYDKEYIATTLSTTAQGHPLSIDTRKKKLVLKLGHDNDNNVLGVAKRVGRTFRIFRLEPNWPGQKPMDKLQRATNAPLYLHTQVKRFNKDTCVFQLGKKVYQIRSGPRMSFEKYCTNPDTGEDVAMWKYRQKQNHVEVFQQQGAAVDVGLIMFLVIIADCFDVDAVMDKAMVAAMTG